MYNVHCTQRHVVMTSKMMLDNRNNMCSITQDATHPSIVCDRPEVCSVNKPHKNRLNKAHLCKYLVSTWLLPSVQRNKELSRTFKILEQQPWYSPAISLLNLGSLTEVAQEGIISPSPAVFGGQQPDCMCGIDAL